jgi:ureidoglycolate hydrolase
MDEKLLQVEEFTDPGFKTLFAFGTWRVAILNYLDEIEPTQIEYVERHNETDEVFILHRGQGVLFIGEGREQAEKLTAIILDPGKVYNVRKGVWHSVVLSRDGSVLLVENRDTVRGNSDYSTLTDEMKALIVQSARSAGWN